jgi:NEDD8-activating enzyme E1 regulatory subunit
MATTDKYDRQLRLWGASGQKRLGETTVILIQATAVGCEVLKNLVLPGVGGFVVVDSKINAAPSSASPTIAARHIDLSFASNFFTPLQQNQHDNPSCHPSPSSRAKVAMEHLKELNDDVKGDFKDVPDLMEVDYDELFLHQSRLSGSGAASILVVASDLEPPILERVARACHNQQVPLVVVHAYGLMGYVRLQTPLIPLINPKPRDSVPDLRLTQPFAALQKLADSIDLTILENHQHGHVPYPIILLKLIHQWKQSNSGKLPSTFEQKRNFQASVKQAARNFEMELNFQEAFQNAYLAYTTRSLDLGHLTRLRDETDLADNAACRRFHNFLIGLEQFYTKHQRAPIQGTIPDMTSSTDWYVQLQRVYLQQAQEDLQELRSMIPHGASGVTIDETLVEELVTFCQNVFHLDLLHARTIQEEWYEETVPEEICEELAMLTMECSDDDEGGERNDQVALLWGLGLSACRLFYQKHDRYPGVLLLDQEESSWETDVEELQACIVQIVSKYNLQECELIQNTLLKGVGAFDYATELSRYGNAEIHNIASLMGGVASQEAVKIITGQYVPLDNTYIYNGIASVGGVYRF